MLVHPQVPQKSHFLLFFCRNQSSSSILSAPPWLKSKEYRLKCVKWCFEASIKTKFASMCYWPVLSTEIPICANSSFLHDVIWYLGCPLLYSRGLCWTSAIIWHLSWKSGSDCAIVIQRKIHLVWISRFWLIISDVLLKNRGLSQRCDAFKLCTGFI